MSSNRDWVNQTLGDPDEATPASSMENTSATSTQDAPKKHTTAH